MQCQRFSASPAGGERWARLLSDIGTLLWLLFSCTISVVDKDWIAAKEFVKSVVAYFNVNSTLTAGSRIGAAWYSTNVEAGFDLADLNTQEGISCAIDGMNRAVGMTQTGKALKFVREQMLTEAKGARPPSAGIPRAIILVTDGVASNENEAIAEAEQLKKVGVSIFVIGIESASVSVLWCASRVCGYVCGDTLGLILVHPCS